VTPINPRARFARKRFLVKPALQLKFLGFTLLIVFLSSVGVYFVFESTLWSSLPLIPLSPAQTATLESSLRLSFLCMLLILLAACGLEGYLYFHRVVGPLFALERELKRIAEGHFDHPARLRTGDELQDIFKTLETAKQSLKDRSEQDRKKILALQEEISRLQPRP